MIMKSMIVFLVAAATLFASCSSEVQSVYRIRASAESKNGGSIVFKVFPENGDGDCMSGASVLAVNSENMVTVLAFDNGTQCYTGTVDGLESDTYTVKVNSVLFDSIQSLKMPHERLVTKPSVISFSDASGNSVLAGSSLSSVETINCTWNALGGGVVYQVAVKTALSTKWTGSTSAATIDIPADTLASGTSYYLYVTAQKMYGDPYFVDKLYYSNSSITSAGISFYVE